MKKTNDKSSDSAKNHSKSDNPNLADLQNRLKHAEKNMTKIYSKENRSNILQSGEVVTASEISQNIRSKINIKNFIYNIILTICLILIIYSSINIILWHKNNLDNTALIKQVTEETPISETKKVTITDDIQIEKNSYDFNSLVSQNPDTVGWITVPNTEINYPVVKSADNEFYLKHSFDKSYNAAGWIYADYRNKCDDTDKNLIIYGHNRLNNNMFGTLENTLTSSWIDDQSNHYINYSSLNNSNIYEVFSIFICNSEDSVNYLRTEFSSDNDYLAYIENIKELSTHNFDVNLTSSDKIISLYTCHGLNNERLIVFAKLVEEKKNN